MQLNTIVILNEGFGRYTDVNRETDTVMQSGLQNRQKLNKCHIQN